MKLVLSLMLTLTSTTAFAGRMVDCQIERIQVNWARMFVKCKYRSGVNLPYVKDMPYYSASLNQANATSMLQVLLKAKELRKNVKVYHEDGPSNNPSGCKGSNCRRLNAVGL